MKNLLPNLARPLKMELMMLKEDALVPLEIMALHPVEIVDTLHTVKTKLGFANVDCIHTPGPQAGGNVTGRKDVVMVEEAVAAVVEEEDSMSFLL